MPTRMAITGIMAKSVSRSGKKLDLKKPGTAAKFRAAAEAYTLRATASKATATLHCERILMPTGRLSKHYARKA